jgi:glycosyltransferase involved in cell wall biosynthesis
VDSLPISVIVIARNASKILTRCLEAIKANNPAEIIVVDGNSSDNTVEIARSFGARVFSDEGKGAAVARQVGAEMAVQDFISYIDADITLAPQTLSTMYRELIASEFTGIRCRLIPPKGKISYWEKASFEIDNWGSAKYDQVKIGIPACLLRRNILLKFRFDPTVFRGAEDAEIERRMVKAGCRFGASSAEVTVHNPGDFRAFWRQKYLWGGGMALIMLAQGPFNSRIWPPIVGGYSILKACFKARFSLIPYFFLESIAQMQGFAVYCSRMAKGKIKKVDKAVSIPGRSD